MRIALFFRKTLRKLLKPLYLRVEDVILARDLDDPLEPPPASPLVCRPLAAEDALAARRDLGDAKAADFAERLTHSKACGLFDRQHLVGWAWACARPKPHEGYNPLYYDVTPREGSVYIYDVYIHPVARGRGAVTTLMGWMLDDLKKAGFRQAFMTCDTRNEPMHRLAARYRFREIGRLRYRRLLAHITRDVSDLEKVCTSKP